MCNARLRLGPANLDVVRPVRARQSQALEIVEELVELRRGLERYALDLEQVEDRPMLLEQLAAPPVQVVVVPGADGDHLGRVPARAVGRRVQHDRVEPDRDLVLVDSSAMNERS